MNERVIVIDMPAERGSQAALIVDGRLEDLLIDPPKGDRSPDPGAIYWAKVDRLVPKPGGAFVRLDPDTQGFLREAKGLRQGAGVLVQVASFPEPGKAAPVTTRLLYKGVLVIHTPDAPGTNVSRQIRGDDERERLADIVDTWQPGPEPGHEPALADFREMHAAGGFIVRSAAEGASAEAIRRDLAAVLSRRSEHEALTRASAPGTAGAGILAFVTALREWAPADRIAVGKSAARLVAGSPEGEVAALTTQIDTGLSDPFDHFGVWDEIERLRSPRVDLPSGAWMAVEATRAMVTVDVNTGDQFSAGAAMTANIEAARELPRQLRLRGLGGQVTIDFAPLKKMDRKKIEDVLKAAFRRDPVQTTLAGWTPLGNFELQRKRERRPLSEVL